MRFIIEYWDNTTRQYLPLWEGDSYKMAETMMNKGYNVKYTRRMKVVDERILHKAKAGKYINNDITPDRQSHISKDRI